MYKLMITMSVCGALLFAPANARASVGLSSQFVDVVFEGLKIGASYDVRALKGVPYTVKNRGTMPVMVRVESVIPDDSKITEPYEAIPDPTWLKLTPEEMRIAPESVGFSDLMITIPNDKSLIGRHFFATLWAHTVDTGLFSAGVRTRIRFSIGPGPATLQAEKLKKAMVTLNYDLWPHAMYVKSAKAGKKYDVKKKENKSFKMTNRADEKLELHLSAVPWPKGGVRKLPRGYEYVEDLSWVSFKPGKLKVNGNSIEEMKLVLNPPKELKGRKVVFLVQVALPIGTPVSASHQVFVTIE